MESHDKLLDTPENTFVLPAHNLPFYGVRERLQRPHRPPRGPDAGDRGELCRAAHTAKDLLPVLFKRKLDARQIMMALGEAIAHCHLLMHRKPAQARSRRGRPLPVPVHRSRSRTARPPGQARRAGRPADHGVKPIVTAIPKGGPSARERFRHQGGGYHLPRPEVGRCPPSIRAALRHRRVCSSAAACCFSCRSSASGCCPWGPR